MNDYEELTRQLTHTLTVHSDEMAGSSLDLAHVQGRARSIRRRRTASAVAGVAAAVAVIVPAVSLATHTGGRPEPAPATSLTPTVAQTATPVDARAPLDVSGLPTGEAPATGYLAGGTIHLGDGGTADVLARSGVSRYVLLADGTVVYLTRDDQGRTAVEVTDSGGSQHGPYPAQEGLASNAAQTVAGWVASDGHPMAWEATATAPTRLSTKLDGTGLQVDALTGSDCSGAEGCRMLIRSTDQQTGEVGDVVVSSAQGVEPADPGGDLVMVNALSETGLRAEFTATGETTSCSEVVTHRAQHLWKTCDHSLQTFSPGSDHVSAYLPYFDGPGSSDVAAYDADSGRLLFDHRSARGADAFVAASVWEDDSHLLGTTYQHGKWYVVRYGIDGSMEIAAGPKTGDVAEAPYVLPGQH
jgi:hypothetical protein